MGDAVRRVQKHLQELSRDHLVSIEDRHHSNLGWLQIELQKMCKQIEVDVRVELMRPPRLSFSKPNALGFPNTAMEKPTTHKDAVSATSTTTETVSVPVDSASRPAQGEEVIVDDGKPQLRAAKKQRAHETGKARAPIPIDLSMSDDELPAASSSFATLQEPLPAGDSIAAKKTVKRIVTRTRKVMKPKRIVTIVKKMVKKERPAPPSIDISGLKVVDLKNELKKRGLKQTGVKAVLTSRLLDALEEEDAEAAQQDLDDAEEVEEEEEVVEEVMEEVDEDYEEEIEEEEVDDVLAVPRKSDSAAEPMDTVMEEPEATEDTQAELQAHFEDETRRMSREDVDAVVAAAVQTTNVRGKTSKVDQHDEEAQSSERSSPNKSLSDLVEEPSADEIVRESDHVGDDMISPEVKIIALAKAMSAHKSPAKPVIPPQSHSIDAPAKNGSENSAKDLVGGNKQKVSDASVKAFAVVEDMVSVRSKNSESSAATGHIDSAQLLQQDKPATTRVTAQLLDGKRTLADSKRLLQTAQQLTNRVLAKSGSTSVDHSKQLNTSVMTSSTTPTASSNRSSSISSVSSIAVSHRDSGSNSFVGETQQSPHVVSFAPPNVLVPPTRAASASKLEMQIVASKMKTPDAPAASKRAAQSEPRVDTLKERVEDEEDRKQREQQENIEREALRFRMAVKQSAKKRFEEAKGSSLFWAKREEAKLQMQRESTTSIQRESMSSIHRDSMSSAPPTPRNVDPAPPMPAPTRAAVVTQEVDILKNDGPVEELQPTQPVKASVASAAVVHVVAAAQAKPSTVLKPATKEPVSKTVVENGRALPSRKRSSIVMLDGSTSNLYPSRKRLSDSRSKESQAAPPAAKRSSLTKDKPATMEVPSKRRRVSRETPAEAVVPSKKRLSREQPAPVPKKRRSSGSSSQQDAPTTKSAATGRAIPTSSATAKRRDSVSSTVSSASNVSTADIQTKGTTSLMSGGAVRKPSNLVSGLHSFTTLLDKDTANLSSSQGSNTSTSSRQAPVLSSLKMAEKSRLIEQKKNLEKMKRKEALMKRYEEQRKLDEDKKKKLAQMKEKAERDARLKRELDKTTQKKQRELELTKQRQQRIQEMRAGLEKKKAQAGGEKEPPAKPKTTSAAVATTASQSTTATTDPAKPNQSKTVLKEVTTYAMSENEAPSESESSDEDKDTRRNSKNIPKWAQRDNLERALRMQFGASGIDPTPSIFPEFVGTCDLEAIFEPTDARKKKRFQRRTSSGNWLADRATTREKAVYKKEMGFER